MGHHTYKDRCGGPYDPDLVQDVEDLVQSVKDDMVMQELGSMDIVRDVQQGGSVRRIGLQRQRTTSEDVNMEDMDAESEVESEHDNLVRAQHEIGDTRGGEPETATKTQPQQQAKDRLHASQETMAKTEQHERPRVARRAEREAKDAAVEQSQPLQLFPDRMIMVEKAVTHHAASGGHGVIRTQPKTQPFAQKTQWISEDDIMEDFDD
ncbi:hypothetical protein G7Y79_00010g028000 [Physcia stellaris]|nr:hypothetical protein G7Y79_00010g028000 [Physcia stellaris]